MEKKLLIVLLIVGGVFASCKFTASTTERVEKEEEQAVARPVGYDTAYLVKGEEVQGRLESMSEDEVEFTDVYGKKHKWNRSEVQRIEFQKLRAGYEAKVVSELKDELLEEVLKRKVKECDYPNATYVVLFERSNVRFDGSGVEVTTRYIAQVVQDAGRYTIGNRALWYLSDRCAVDILWARTILPDGSVKHLSDTAVEDGAVYPTLTEYNLLRKRKFALSEMSIGSVADICVKTKYKRISVLEPFYAEFLFGETEPILHKEVVVEYSTGTPVKAILNRKARTPVSYEKIEEGGMVVERFVASGIKALLRESDMPPMSEIVPSVTVCYSEEKWEKLGAELHKRIKKNLEADENIRQKVEELIKGVETEEEKAKRLYHFLVREKDYVEIGLRSHRYEPHSVTTSFQKGCLNGLDKAALLVSMLRVAGLDAHLLLVRGRKEGRFVEEAVSVGGFDDALVFCKLDGRETYLAPFSSEIPFGYIPGEMQGGVAIIVNEKNGGILTVPILNAKEELYGREVESSVEPDGTYRARVRLNVRGGKEEFWRKKAALKPEELQRDMLKFLKNVDTRAVLDEMKLENLQEPTKPLKIEYAYHIPDWALKAGEKLLVFKLPEINYSAEEIETEERENPLWWNTRTLIRNRYVVTIPEKFKVRYVPKEEFKSEDVASGLSYRASFKSEDGKVVFEDETVRNSLSLETAKYSAYVHLLSERAKVAQEWIVLEAK
ncbi:MAG: DUF3857 and transglutaminase domain-containing protein [Planctomycetota bacterium]|nr:DUF3857 and transglutaminase domain-containing protein [Planctomycetota bacterium]